MDTLGRLLSVLIVLGLAIFAINYVIDTILCFTSVGCN